MKPAPFEYERAADLTSALSALARYGSEAKVLAGGQNLIPMLNLRLASAERLIYGAAKHGVVAMSHTINQQECVNGIRSTVFLPGEVATPILDKRPNPVGLEERAP